MGQHFEAHLDVNFSAIPKPRIGDENPADTEISGATAPAVPAELSPKEAAEVNDIPLGHAPEAGALNGHASSPSPQQADKE